MMRAFRNIWTIFVTDLRRLMSNAIAAIVVVGLALTPPLYAWFTTLGFWDPYSNTGNIEVAIANEDMGFDSDLVPMKVDIGDSVVSALRGNDQFDWVFVDQDEALEGLRAGRYYAAIVIPSDFSSTLMESLTGDINEATITYYSNEKENAIAPKVTGTGASALQEDIDAAFTKTVINISLTAANDLSGFLDGDGVSNYGSKLSESFDQAIQRSTTAATTTHSFSLLVKSSSEMADATAEMLEDIDGSLSAAAPLAQRAMGSIERIDSSLQGITEGLGELKGLQAGLSGDTGDPSASKAKEAIDALARARDRLESVRASMEEAGASADDAIESYEASSRELIDRLRALSNDLTDLSDSLSQTSDILSETASSLSATKAELDDALGSGDLEKVRSIIGSDQERLAGFLTKPVEIERHAIYPIENNGSAMSPFYSSLSLWIGAIFMVALMEVKVPEGLRRRLKDPTGAELYLGRFGVFAFVGLVQATILCAGNLLLLGVHCVSPFMYFVTGWICSLVFCNIIYTLTAVLGNIGKALAIIGLVMQIGGSGGIFPIQLSAPIFQAIYPWLPFSHSMEAFQSCIAGSYGNQLLVSLGELAAFIIPFTLIGILFARAGGRMNDLIEEKLESTKVLS